VHIGDIISGDTIWAFVPTFVPTSGDIICAFTLHRHCQKGQPHAEHSIRQCEHDGQHCHFDCAHEQAAARRRRRRGPYHVPWRESERERERERERREREEREERREREGE
jgi:hypothetical protein